MPTVYIPASLRRFTSGAHSVQLDASNVRDLIDQLEAQYPGLRKRLCDGDRLRPGLAVAIDSRVYGHSLLETLPPDCEVHFVPTVSGG